MGKFDDPTTEVLYRLSLDGTGETIGNVSTWGEVHVGLGQVTYGELRNNADILAEASGTVVEDFPDGAYWIVHEDGQGLRTVAAMASDSE